MVPIDKALTAFCIVFLSSALWPNLPNVSLIIIASIGALLCVYFLLSAYLSGALLGFVWAALSAHWYISWQLPDNIFEQNVIIEGKVSSITSFEPEHAAYDSNMPTSIRFNMQLDSIGKYRLWHSPNIRITWYQPSHIPKQGQRLRLLASLKAPSGLANPHTFHYQTWLASKNIVATGYIVPSKTNQLVNDNVSLRQISIDKLSALTLHNDAWLKALSFGYRGELKETDWSLLQSSGTAHLFAISGLHVGIVFAYCMLIFTRPLALVSSSFADQAHIAKLISGIAALTCLLYSYLAGFEVPVLRAIFALLLWTYLVMTQSHWRLPAVLLYLLVSFFILFPYSILGISFWFSFSAVLSIWLFVWRFMPRGRLAWKEKFKYGLYLQIYLSVVTMPLSLFIFGQLPVFSLVANLLLVPWVSLVLVPLCLIASFLMLLAFPQAVYASFFNLADLAMEPTLYIMNLSERFAELVSIDALSLDSASLLILGIAMLLILLPFWSYRKRLLFFCLCMLLMRAYIKPPFHPTMTVYDVGQGSAALFRFVDAQGQQQVWLFDTGASFASGFSMAEAVILPMLDAYKIKRLNALILSHLDNDHAGGVDILSKHLEIDRILSPKNKCKLSGLDQTVLEQANISARVLWPVLEQSGEHNNHSCVIKLEVNGHSILFTGDIEAPAERDLMAALPDTQALASSILLAPHHGSRSSSTEAFVQAVSPQYVVFSAAQPNRWGFPHTEVLARYQALDAQLLQTGKLGAIEFVFEPQGKLQISRYRQNNYQRWYFK